MSRGRERSENIDRNALLAALSGKMLNRWTEYMNSSRRTAQLESSPKIQELTLTAFGHWMTAADAWMLIKNDLEEGLPVTQEMQWLAEDIYMEMGRILAALKTSDQEASLSLLRETLLAPSSPITPDAGNR